MGFLNSPIKTPINQNLNPKAATHVTFITQEQVCLSWRVSQESLRTLNNLSSMSVYHSVLFNNGHQFGWWVSRDYLKMKYWGGASLSNKCACVMTNSCVNPGYGCNCDANDNLWREDSTLFTYKTRLPVKHLRFGSAMVSCELSTNIKLGNMKLHSK